MLNKSKYLLLLLLGITVLVYNRFPSSHSSNSTTNSPLPVTTDSINLTLIIDTGSTPPQTFTSPYSASESAFSLLQKISNQNDLKLKSKIYSFGNLVESLSSLSNTPDRAWIYLVNSQSPNIGASDYLLKPGDRVEWKYVKPQ